MNRTIPAGSCPLVGIAGLALAGGMGLASRRHGLTCDNVSALTMVTADGRLRRCDATSNEDLFWACRGGGGGNFGIVTSFDLTTHPITSASWFVASWPWASASEALAAWQDFAPATTSRLTSIPMLSTSRRGPDVRAFGRYFGTPAQLRALVAPLSRVGGALCRSGPRATWTSCGAGPDAWTRPTRPATPSAAPGGDPSASSVRRPV